MTYSASVNDNVASQLDSSSVSSAAPSAVLQTLRAQSSSQTQSAVSEIADDSAKVSLAGAMLSQAASGSEVRFDKVAALRQSIEAGTFAPASGAVAQSLISAMQQ